MSSSIQLRPAEEHDLATIAALKVAAFQYSPYQQALWPSRLRQKPGTQDQVEWTLSQLHGALGRSRMRLMVAVDETSGEERIAGYAEWISPQSEPEVKSGVVHDMKHTVRPKIPESLDVDAMRKGGDEISKMLGGDDCIAAFQGKDRDRMWSKCCLFTLSRTNFVTAGSAQHISADQG